MADGERTKVRTPRLLLVTDESTDTGSCDVVRGDPATPARALDRGRLLTATVSLVLLLLGAVGWASGSSAAKWTGFTLFALIGFGSASVIALRRSFWSAPAFSAPFGMTIVFLVGFSLVETHAWSLGMPLFVVLVAVAAIVNLWEVIAAASSSTELRGRVQSLLPRGRQALPVAAQDDESLHAELSAGEGLLLAARRRRMEGVAIASSGVGLSLCVIGSLAIHGLIPHGPGAVLAALPPLWYLGLALALGGVLLGLVTSGRAAAFGVVALQAVLTLTPAIVYALPRYSWTYKHLGVVEYVLRHGSVNPTVDIYQSWPAFFAGVAWICHAVGISNPTALARWWPPVVDMAVVCVMQRLAFRVLGDARRAWTATAVLVVGNMIGQDYFSPQSAGFFLAVAVFAAVYRRSDEPRGMDGLDWLVTAAMLVAVSVTHQLSPYMIFGATTVLAVFGLCRSRWVPVVAVASAGGWALLHFGVVRRYFNFSQFGNVASNALTKGFVAAGIHKAPLIRYDSYAMALDAGLIGVMAVLVLVQRRARLHVALALCAASGSGLFLANSYGNEGAFRVVMFALPWLAVLCADWDARTAPRLYWLPVISLPILLGSYLVADWGLDYMNAVRPSDLKMEQTFETNAHAGSRLYILGSYLPVKSTYRYSLFKYRSYPYIVSGRPSRVAPSKNTARVTRNLSSDQGVAFNPKVSFAIFMQSALPARSTGLRKHAYYVIAGGAPQAASEELGSSSPSQYEALVAQFLHSRDWKVVARAGHSYLFKLVSLFYDSSRPAITGLDQDGQQLTLDRGVWQSMNPLRYAYQWESCDAAGANCAPIIGATHERLHLTASDVGHRLKAVVTVVDSRGLVKQVTAGTYPIGKPFAPANMSPPSVVGQATKNGRLKVHLGKWQSPDALSFAYQWEECSSTTSTCTPLPGRTKPNLRMRYSYVGRYFTAVVTATDKEGQSSQVVTARVGPVAP